MRGKVSVAVIGYGGQERPPQGYCGGQQGYGGGDLQHQLPGRCIRLCITGSACSIRSVLAILPISSGSQFGLSLWVGGTEHMPAAVHFDLAYSWVALERL